MRYRLASFERAYEAPPTTDMAELTEPPEIEVGDMVAAERFGKAFGMKSHPVLLAALCHTCHLNNGHARDDKHTAFSDWNLAHKRTIAALYDEGKLKPV
jgi:hypothetical protein